MAEALSSLGIVFTLAAAANTEQTQIKEPIIAAITNEKASTDNLPQLSQICMQQLSSIKTYPGLKGSTPSDLKSLCDKAQLLPRCQSVEQQPIFHFDFDSENPLKKKILVFSLIHGDETPAGQVIRYWTERLNQISGARNQWRIIPILNPDGVKKVSRLNSRGVDLNRNFPTQDWDTQAHSAWKKLNENPRRFPGPQANSEPETQCALDHIEDYKPFFVVSIHTPLAVLDFDGPKLNKKLPYGYLPWRSLGHFPGSLGRYLWFERQVPVLTAEFLADAPANEGPLRELQDALGTLVNWL